MVKKGHFSSFIKLAFLLVILFFILGFMELPALAATIVYVSPPSSTVSLGQTLLIDIKISDVTDIYGWEFKLTWNPNLLDILDVTEGPFLKLGGSTFFAKKINNTAGYILVDCTLLGAVPGVSGSGTLATVQLYAETIGTSALDLYDTVLLNSLEQTIIHTVNDGTVNVTSPFHDVAIVSVVPSKTVVGQGLIMRIWVIAENQGGYTETFDVSVYYDSTNLIATQSVTLTAGTSLTITFKWNTTGIAKGNYILSAVASMVAEEANTVDNIYVDGIITIAMVGDITGPTLEVPDGKADIRDIAMLAKAFGSYPGRSNWNPNADINDNDKVDIKDIAIVAKNYGKIDP